MPAAIIAAVVSAGTTAYNAYAASNVPGVPPHGAAADLIGNQKKLDKLNAELSKLNVDPTKNADKIRSVQQQIAAYKLSIGAQTNQLSLGGLTPTQGASLNTPVINLPKSKPNWLLIGGIALFAVVGYFFVKK